MTRFAVIGTGGVGGVFGAELHAAGYDVSFTARGGNLAALRANGLQVFSPGATLRVPPERFFGNPADIGPVDVILLCVKSYDTESALRQLTSTVRSDTVVISLQNGVEKAEMIQALLPGSIFFDGVAYVAAVISGPGQITEVGSPRRILFAPPHDAPQNLWKRARDLCALCRMADFKAEVPVDISLELWKKFIFITAAGGLTALMRMPLKQILGTEESRQLFIDAMGETESVARARGISIPSGYTGRVMESLAGVDPAIYSSLYYDLIKNKPLEIDALSGTVARLGFSNGIPTPVHRMIYAALVPHHRQHLARMNA
jgi:2-dehydropantoate 2-reductase